MKLTGEPFLVIVKAGISFLVNSVSKQQKFIYRSGGQTSKDIKCQQGFFLLEILKVMPLPNHL